MNTVMRNFRRWWQPPRNIHARAEHRQVTFLELFYDLVYVVLISQLTHSLASNINAQNITHFIFLFVIVWWAWLNGSAYHELHGNDDIRTRIFTFLQMATVVMMAIFVHSALDETSVGFALSYAAFQIILTYLWWRTGVHDPIHRPLSRPYIVVYLLTTAVFIGSVFVTTPLRFYLWGGVIFISVLLPLNTFLFTPENPEVRAQRALTRTATPSLVERFGLLTIIVLGELIVAVVQGMATYDPLTWATGLNGMFGMGIAIGLWWLYFDLISHRTPRAGLLWFPVWVYTHLFITGGIAAIGASILNVVQYAGEELPIAVRWLLVSALSLVLMGIALLLSALDVPQKLQPTHQLTQRVIIGSALLILALGLTQLQTLPLLIAILGLMFAPIFFALLSWIKNLDNLPAPK